MTTTTSTSTGTTSTTSSSASSAAANILSTLNKTNGSGLDTKALTTSLVQAEIAPRQSIQTRKANTADLAISALGQVRSALAKMQATLTSIDGTPNLIAVSDTPAVAVSVTDRTKLTDSIRSVGVTTIAKRQTLEFKGFTSADAPIGSGSLTVDFGTWFGSTFTASTTEAGHTLTIPADATLTDLAKVLNTLQGVQATIIDKGDGTFSLGVVGEMGASHSLRFTAAEDPTASGLAAFDTTTTNADHEVQAASDAKLMVDGIAVTRSTNSITDLFPGVQLDILAPTTSAANVTVAHDSTTTYSNLSNLVSTINDTRGLLDSLTARATDTTGAGALATDQAVTSLRTALNRLISAPLEGFGATAVHLSDLGVKTQLDGTLMLDKAGFDTAFATSPTKFDALFSDQVTASTTGVTVSGKPQASATPGKHSFLRDPVTGNATFDGVGLKAGTVSNGLQSYTVSGGSFVGMTITVPVALSSTTISYGRSMEAGLNSLMTEALQSGGSISRSEAQDNAIKDAAQTELDKLDKQSATLTDRYTAQFTAMEAAITQFKSTGTYLNNLITAWQAAAKA